MVASAAARRGCRGRFPRPLPCQGVELGPGDRLVGGRRLAGRGRRRPFPRSAGTSQVYLVPRWASFSGTTRRMGWPALYSLIVLGNAFRRALVWFTTSSSHHQPQKRRRKDHRHRPPPPHHAGVRAEVLITHRRHDERYTIQAEGTAATTLYTWATRGHLPHPTLQHAPSWPTAFNTADRPNKRPKHAGVHTPAQKAQHRHDARRKARTFQDNHTIPRISDPPTRGSDATDNRRITGFITDCLSPAARRRVDQRGTLPHTGGGAPQ